MEKQLFIIANWKMNPSTLKSALGIFREIKKQVRRVNKNVKVIFCPPFLYLDKLLNEMRALRGQGQIEFGVQNCFFEKTGAFTGEISPLMLKNLGAKYVILGHSERRKYFQESDEIIAKKTKAVLDASMKAIFCFGETERERRAGRTTRIIKNQIQNGLSFIGSERELLKLIFAYEPVWAIGTGKNCPAKEAFEILMYTKKVISQMFSRKIADKIKVVYGGSVNSSNFKEYILSGYDGLLVGGVSLSPKDFSKIIKGSLQKSKKEL